MIDSLTLCLSLAIFYEARSESKKGQYAVAEVIHNRVKSDKFPNSICKVIKSKGQFSWFKNHKSMTPPKYELEAWRESIAVARDFQIKKTNYTNGALYFNTVNLGVRYKTKVKPVKRGNHVFY